MSAIEPGLRLDTYDYSLPDDRIAQEPAARREDARLLRIPPPPGLRLIDETIPDLAAALRPGDLLIVNDTRVLPGKMYGVRERTGGQAEALLLNAAPDAAEILLKTRGKPHSGEDFRFCDGELSVRLVTAGDRGSWRVSLSPSDPEAIERVLSEKGFTPLPPYIRRDGQDLERATHDTERYQTVYAAQSGAVAAPTAGLHLTNELLETLSSRGVERASVTLHVGLGTFRPIEAEDVRDHVMHEERWSVSEATAAAISACRERGGRVVAVGTTSVRTLESAADDSGHVRAGSGATDLMIHPGRQFRVVDALLTNFHAPKSTLLLLLAAALGVRSWRTAYEHALTSGYRFLSYGDAMFLESMQPRDAKT